MENVITKQAAELGATNDAKAHIIPMAISANSSTQNADFAEAMVVIVIFNV